MLVMAIQQFSRSLPIMLYRALDAVMPRFRAIFKEFGITEQQWRVLRVLSDVDAIPLGQLADVTLIPAPSLVGIVDRLQTAALVERRPAKGDRRVVLVQISQVGQERLDRLMPQVANAYATLKQGVPAAEWDRLLEGLEQLINATETDRRRPPV